MLNNSSENMNAPASSACRECLPDVRRENEILRQEIRVSREAAEITASLVVRQFEETEKILRRFQIANEQRKAVLNSATQIAIVATDCAGMISIFNTGAENLLGYKAEEVVGKKTLEIFLESVLDTNGSTATSEYSGRISGAVDVLFEYALLGSAEHLEWICIRRDGSRFPVSMTVNALRNPDGDVAGMLCIASDISERKQAEAALKTAHNELEARVRQRTAELAKINQELETEIRERSQAEKALRESEEKYRSIFENLTEGFFQSTPGGRLLTVNPAMVRFMGYGSEIEMIENIADIKEQFYVNPRDRDEFRRRIETEGSVRSFETRFYRKDGNIIDVSLNARLIREENGAPLFYEGMLQDITQRKRSEELKIAKEAAEAATKAKSNFLANMSHEIRTPMNAIIGLTELALRTEMNPRLGDYLNKIHTSAHSLLGLINDILDFSKIEAGRMELENNPFSLRTVMDSLSDMFSGKVAEKGIEMVIHIAADVPCALTGDSLRLSQILINLTNNAVKFTEKGEVVIRVSQIRAEGERVRLRFEIADTGIGIDRDFLPFLFTSFSQADASTTRKYGGTGLGLTICRQLVRLMKGDIRAESRAGQGSVFSFTAEFGLGAGNGNLFRSVPERLGRRRVLVVDNNETSRHIYSEILSSFSCTAASADSAEEAIAKLTQALDAQPYDLVLMDWRMPGTDGITALEQIRQTPGISDIPVILMTAFGREEIMQRAQAAGASAFLIKPVKQSVLYDTLMTVFDQAGKDSLPKPGIPEPSGNVRTDFLKGKQILLVEDNLINQQVATEILRYAGAAVETADNGNAALEALRDCVYDAVLMDVQMPELDGYQTSRLIRENPRWRKLPVIAMTAHAMKGDREKCLEAGMNDYVTKPIDTESLFSVLSQWIASSRGESVPEEADSVRPASGDEDFGSLFADISGIDISAVRTRIGNPKFLAKLLREFAETHADAAQDIRGAIGKEDWETAFRLVHNIKGVAGNLSVPELYEAALDLENLVRKKDADKLPDTLSVFEKILEKLLRSVINLKAGTQSSPQSGPVRESGKIAVLIRKLAERLKKNDLDAEKYFDALKQEAADQELGPALEKLESHMNSLDFELALGQLKVIAQQLIVSPEGEEAHE
ncbi:MAG: response regulator [Desulfobacterales bacterium]